MAPRWKVAAEFYTALTSSITFPHGIVAFVVGKKTATSRPSFTLNGSSNSYRYTGCDQGATEVGGQWKYDEGFFVAFWIMDDLTDEIIEWRMTSTAYYVKQNGNDASLDGTPTEDPTVFDSIVESVGLYSGGVICEILTTMETELGFMRLLFR